MNARSAKTLICVSCFALVLVSLEVEAADARAWLERMNRAVEDLNYEGTFVHVLGGNAETMYIVHRNHNGEVGERLVSLDGAGREIIGREDQLQVIMPDRHIVLLKKRKEGDSLFDALPNYSSKLEAHYEFKLNKTARVANRTAQVIVIKPKDQYRYGYVLWLDEDTAYPL
ncbi:MAG TPA: sigma-E factor regulatory protein RseB domain-containing protein, partial [Gammaproteobacteria bacterium]|nr:sigma-E factor regulatory protein RseB domain-containing protein [Gammaproteobacteria bacterium]